MATNASPSPQARIHFEDAFNRFEQTVNFDDKREFQLTTLKDVREAARQIERDLGDRGCLRNMRRLQPFFDGLDRYSKIIEVLCNGTPYLPYIWVSQMKNFRRLDQLNNPNYCAGTCKTHAEGTLSGPGLQIKN